MHEMSIAEALIEHVLAAAASAGADRVEQITVEAGELKLVVPEALQMAFSAVAEGTAAEGAEVHVVETPPQARCRACGNGFRPRKDNYLCPACGQADVAITAGDAIILKSVTCFGPDDPPANRSEGPS